MFRIHVPRAPLNQYIECLWYAHDKIVYQREHILPTGTIEILLNFGSPFRVYDHNDDSKFILNSTAWIVGLQTEYIINEPVAETHMMGIRVKPHALSLFVEPPADSFHNQLVELDCVWGRWADELRELLYDLPTVEGKFRRLEGLLLQSLLPEHHALEHVRYAVSYIRRQQGSLSVRELSEDIGLSHKHLIHHFKQLVGVPPKALSKLVRFQSALMNIDPQDAIDWSEIAMGSNYFDQSHFNKDFASFTGMSPTQYLAHRQQVFGGQLEQGEDIHFVPIG